MIKNIWMIYKEDLNRVFKNYAAIIVILALCILPSLYAWFNIKASWDPYGQEATSQIKIGVINNDKGTIFNGNTLNIGNQVIEQLKGNDLMGWQFVTEAEGEKALKEGKFYATITIPDNFSQDITSFVSSDVKKGQIIYRFNEKINAIAPKLTSKGATGIQESINQTIVETVSGILFQTGKELGSEIQDLVLPQLSNVYQQLEELVSKFDDMNSLVQTAHDGGIQLKDLILSIQNQLPLIHQTITSAEQTLESLETFIDESKSALNDFMPTIKDDLLLIQTITNDLSSYVNQLEDLITTGSESAPKVIEGLIVKVESTQNLMDSFTKVLETFNQFLAGHFDDLISQLQNAKTQLSQVSTFLQQVHDGIINGGQPDLTVLDNIKTLLTSVGTTSTNIYNRFDSTISPTLTTVIEESYQTADNILSVLKEAENTLPNVEALLNTAYEGSEKGIDAIEYINSKLPEAFAFG